MDKRLLIIISVICFILVSPIFVSAKEAKPIKIGVVYPMSGSSALPSVGMLSAHKIAGAEIMKAGGFQGRRVEFIARDDAANPELTTRFCRELITKNEVDWLMAGFGSGLALAATAVAKEFKTPTFIFGGKTEKITVEDWNPYTFRYQITSTAEARACANILAREVLKDIKEPKIYWISWDYEYGRSLHGPFMARIKELIPNVKIVGEAWPRTGEVDYGPFINHMLAVAPTVVVNATWGGGIVSFLKQGKAMGLWDRTTLISMAEVGSIEYRKAYGMDMPLGTWSNTYDDVVWPNNEAQRKFYQGFYDYTGEKEPYTGFVNCAYYMVALVDAAMKKAKSTDAMKVIKAMEGITIDTYQGPITVRDFDHQVTSGEIWAPMIKKEGLPYLVLDSARAKFIPCTPDLYSKEEWLARRKAAGK